MSFEIIDSSNEVNVDYVNLNSYTIELGDSNACNSFEIGDSSCDVAFEIDNTSRNEIIFEFGSLGARGLSNYEWAKSSGLFTGSEEDFFEYLGGGLKWFDMVTGFDRAFIPELVLEEGNKIIYEYTYQSGSKAFRLVDLDNNEDVFYQNYINGELSNVLSNQKINK